MQGLVVSRLFFSLLGKVGGSIILLTSAVKGDEGMT